MSYRIHTTAQAEADIERIFTWLARRSPQGAARWYESFWDAAGRLREFPHLSTLAHEAKDFPEELRCLFFGTTRGRTSRGFFSPFATTSCDILSRQGPWAKTRESCGY